VECSWLGVDCYVDVDPYFLFPLSSIPMPSSDLKKDSSLVMMPQRRYEFATGVLFQRPLCALLRNSTGARGFVIGLPSGASGFTLMKSQMTSELGMASQKIQD
jgi:hypothetical protein